MVEINPSVAVIILKAHGLNCPVIGQRLAELLKIHDVRGTWVAQWVKASAFGSGHDLRVL